MESGSYWLLIALVYTLFRYLRTVVSCYSEAVFRPIPVPENPTYSPEDVTIICATIATGGHDLETALRTCLTTNPKKLILSTVHSNVQELTKLGNKINADKIRVVSVPAANKRRQQCRAIPEVTTRVTIFVDDDVIWPDTILPWMLAPFENPEVYGVGTSQRLERRQHPTFWQNVWAFEGAIYLERRNFDCASCQSIDGGLPCLSGRTAAYRSKMLQTDDFLYEFTHESFGGRQLNAADDDNFVTRWVYDTLGKKICMQYHPEAEVRTTLEANPRFLKQCLRWSRSNWRSNLTSMFSTGFCWRTHLWTTYAVFQTTLTSWAVLSDPFIIAAWWWAVADWSPSAQLAMHISTILLVAVSKLPKTWRHYWRYPADLKYTPFQILFGYLHSFIKLYAFCTLHRATWGSRAGADDDDRSRMIKLPRAPDHYRDSSIDGRQCETLEYAEKALDEPHPPYNPPPCQDIELGSGYSDYV